MNKQELQSLLEGVRTALTGNQSKLDKNQNNKIDREDFTLLRSKKKPMAENADLLALLEHLYGVLLHEKAARLQEEKKRLGGAQMESAEYDSILENIYNLLAEEGPATPEYIPDYPQPPATWPRDKNGHLIDWPWPPNTPPNTPSPTPEVTPTPPVSPWPPRPQGFPEGLDWPYEKVVTPRGNNGPYNRPYPPTGGDGQPPAGGYIVTGKGGTFYIVNGRVYPLMGSKTAPFYWGPPLQ